MGAQVGDMTRIARAEDGVSADAMGMIGWGIYGGLNVFNFMYFGDLYYKRYTMGRYNWDGLSFRTIWGASVWFKTMLHVLMSFVLMLLWCLTFIPWSGFWYAFYYMTVYFFTGYYLIRTALLILTQCIALMGHKQGHHAEELQWEEYKLEAANVMAVLLAGPMFSAGMKFWYFNADAKYDQVAKETRAKQAKEDKETSTNKRMLDVSDVLTADAF